MLLLKEIQNYFRAGGGKNFGFYITTTEMYSAIMALPTKFQPYTLIASRCIDLNLYSYLEIEITDFLKLSGEGYDRFYLRSAAISIDLDLSSQSMNGEENAKFQKYYLYNGLIDIQHGMKQEGKIIESSISMIDQYFIIGEPEKVFSNSDYLEIFKHLQTKIKSTLKYNSKTPLLNGNFLFSKQKNVSEEFASCLKSGKLLANIKIV
jgi:hypothetical protein